MEPREKTPEESYDPEHKIHTAPIRTFSSDMAQAVRERGGSVVRIAIAEDEKRRAEMQESSIRTKKNMTFTIGGALLVLAAVGVLVYSYQSRQAPVVQVPAAPALPASLIRSEDVQVINASGMQNSDIIAAIQAIVANPGIQAGNVKNIILGQGTGATRSIVPLSQFFSVLNMSTPPELLRALLPDYMIGTYLYDKGSLFLIIHGTAHDYLLTGMLAWEPNLFDDMKALFAIDTSSISKAQLQHMVFSDAVISNRDARAVLDADKKPLLYYSFLDQNTIIIATDSKTLGEAVRRF